MFTYGHVSAVVLLVAAAYATFLTSVGRRRARGDVGAFGITTALIANMCAETAQRWPRVVVTNLVFAAVVVNLDTPVAMLVAFFVILASYGYACIVANDLTQVYPEWIPRELAVTIGTFVVALSSVAPLVLASMYTEIDVGVLACASFVVATVVVASWWATVVVNRRLRILTTVAIIVEGQPAYIAKRPSTRPVISALALVGSAALVANGALFVIVHAACAVANVVTVSMAGGELALTVAKHRELTDRRKHNIEWRRVR